MRDIKFRTYVRFLREMHEVREMIFDKGAVMIDAYQYGLDRGDAPVMQYTGFTDINGIEIYEDDLIKKDDDKFVRCGVVSFIHGCWMVASKDGDSYFNLHHYLNQVKVIGNIHQHPELLEGDK